MVLEIESLSDLDRKVVVSFKVDDFNNELKKHLLEKQKQLKIPGFRPGKAPLKMVDGMYGQTIKEKLLNDLATKEFYNLIISNKIKLAGLQKLDLDEDSSNDQEIKINVFFDVYPDDIQIANFESLEVEKIISKVEKDDINNTIQMLREQKATFELTEAEAKVGNRVIVDFEGFIDNVRFEGGLVKNYSIILGTNQMLADFENSLLGMKSNDEKDIKIVFPETYHEKKLAGKEAVFKVKLKSVANINLAKLDETFIKSLGIKDGKLESLSEEINKNLNREVNFRSHSLTKQIILDKLLEKSSIKLPSSLVEGERLRLKSATLKNLEKQGMSVDKLPQFDDNFFLEKAKKRISLGLILNKIVELNNLKATDDQVKQVVAAFAENYEDPQIYMQWYLKDKNNLQDAKAVALENNVIDLILSKAKVIEKNYSFKEIMALK